MNVTKSVRHVLLLAVVLACAVSLAAAADLGGTRWEIGGFVKSKVKKIGREKQDIPTAYLSFEEDGQCELEFSLPGFPVTEAITPVVTIGCTWESGHGRRFTVNFNDEDLQDALSLFLGSFFSLTPDELQVTTEKAKGKVSKDLERIKLKVGLKADVAAEVNGETVNRRMKTKMIFTGTAVEEEGR